MQDFLNSIISGNKNARASFGNSLTAFANRVNGSSSRPTASQAFNSALGSKAPTPAASNAPVQTAVAASPAAVSPTPVAIKPVVNTPAAQGYINTLTPAQTKQNAAEYASGKFTYGGGTPAPVGSTPANVASSSTAASAASSNPSDPYLRYLTGMTDPATVSDAQKKYNDAQAKLADIQNQEDAKKLAGTRDAAAILSASGGLRNGAQVGAQNSERRTNQELADLAVQEGAAARTAGVYQNVYQQYLDAGKTVYEASTAASKAAQDQSNADRTAKLAQDKADEDKRQFNITSGQNQEKIDQTSPNSAATKATQAATATTNINLINQLLTNPNISHISGYVDKTIGGLYPSGDTALALNQFNQIKGILTLANRGQLKGQGAVSDFEGKTLDRAASSLDRNLDDANFKKQLIQVKGAIATSNGLPAIVTITNPKTHESAQVTTDSAGIAHAIQDGNIVEYSE